MPTNNESLEARLREGARLHAEGYNCAQSVAGAFADLFPEGAAATMLAALAPFGLGCGDMSQLCGAVSGANAVRGLLEYAGPQGKPHAYKRSREFMQAFSDTTGALRCCELKGKRLSCPELIAHAITVLHAQLDTAAR